MNHVGTKIINTERLVLRRFTENDAKEIYEGYVNQEDFLYYANKEKRTLQEEIESLKGIEAKYNNPEYYNWLITLNNKVIGAIHLNVDNYNESVEFNYAIDDRYKGNGYMTEALEAVKEYCLNKIETNRISGGCEINNIASKKVMEKCNFKYEGTLRNHLKLRDGYHDMCMYSFIRNRD
ncbi:MAG: GNAT family N-acetyltransferase [Bacilli bacterium]|nr:GNAT family N-acetyltransferase [Bacilli bacterium]